MNNNRIEITHGHCGYRRPINFHRDTRHAHRICAPKCEPRVEGTTQIIVDGPKIGTRLFEHEHREEFLHILEQLQLLNKLNWKQDFKRLRAVCKIGQQAFEVFQRGDPIGKFWNKCIILIFINNLIKNDESIYKLDFVSKYNFNCSLKLFDKDEMQSFRDYLKSKESYQNTSVQKTQTIERLELSLDVSNEDGQRILKEILKQISLRQDTAFSNLRYLRTSEISDLTDFALPSSIETFESWLKNKNVNICGFQHLKSIIFDFVSVIGSFKMENLPNLESITINTLWRDIKINLGEFPKLISINVNKENIVFDRSINELTIKRTVNVI
ncbi:MAG: hypothetical protein C5B43_00145 [Verrucomicrobia bacterium]|nr:MAG: hypothetical protein C5B43_00145 [Verrucomicrobiota bacterium]